jgi:transposase InsO family protein
MEPPYIVPEPRQLTEQLRQQWLRVRAQNRHLCRVSHRLDPAHVKLNVPSTHNNKGLRRLKDLDLVQGLDIDLESPMPNCVTCTEAKLAQEPFKRVTHTNRAPSELTHIDVWGKYDTVSIEGHRYYVLFVDDAARYITVHFLKGKDGASSKVMEYLAYLRTQDKPPKAIRVDRGKEFINDTLQSWCRGHGIETNMTAPYSPSQNGVAERMNRMLVELSRAMLTGQNMPEFLWEQAVAHAAYVRNRAYTRALETATPYEVWFKRKPQVAHLREFSVPVWVLLQGQKVPHKMLPKSKRRAFVGFEDGPKAIKYYNAETRKILTSQNYRFLTPQENSPPEEIVVAPDVPHEGELRGSAPPTSDPLIDQTESRDKANAGSKRKQPEEEEYIDLDAPRKTRGKHIDYRYLNDPFPDEEEDTQEDDLVTQLCASTTNAVALSGGDEPKSLREAQRSPEWLEWEHAVNEELDQLRKRGTWILVDYPMDAIPITKKWVFAKKYNKDGDLLRYKGRLVVKGCAQRPGQDYTETFSPVIRLETLRAILAMAVQKDLHIRQMDVKGAYLNGTLKEKVYMRQPEGYDDKTGRVCRLIKTLYGLKQSGREWNNELDRKLKKHEFNRLRADPCAYIRRNGVQEFAVITVWVDDLMLFANSAELNERTKKDLQSEWDMTDLGEPSKIVGIEITRTENSITISQKQYIETILRNEKMLDANPVAMPMDPNVKLEPNPDGNEGGNRSNSYARLLGELQFLANATRPDIAYAVNRLAAYSANPTLQHASALKRILRYLAGTKDYGIPYRKSPENLPKEMNSFHGFSDAAYANADDCKSTSGYVFISGGGAITWRSKKQTTVALSSTEAEYVALSEAGREACWSRNLYEELGEEQKSPILIKGDNDGSIAMARNPQFHKRSKHINIRWHWVRDLNEQKVIEIKSCRDPEQTADVLTKALARPKHQRHVGEMGMAPA